MKIWNEIRTIGMKALRRSLAPFAGVDPCIGDLSNHCILKPSQTCIWWQVLESEASTAGTATFIGTPHYLSPEVFRGEVYDERADAWALGCVIYEMVCQLRPFHRFESNVALLSLRISQGEYDRDLLAQQCKDQSTVQGSVEGLLQANPEERLRAVDVIPDWLELLACCNWDQSTSTAPSCWSEVPTHPETSEASAASARSLDSDSWCHAELQTGGDLADFGVYSMLSKFVIDSSFGGLGLS